MNRRLLIILLLIIGIIAAAFLLNGYVRETIAPAVLAWVWRVSIMSQGIPQVLIWAFFVAIIPIAAVFSLIQGYRPQEQEPVSGEKHYEGQVSDWARQMVQAAEGDYFRARLQRNLLNLVLDTIAYEGRQTRSEVRDELRRGQLSLAPEVNRILVDWSYVREGEPSGQGTPGGDGTARQIGSVLHNFDPNVETIINYLETELEVNGGN